MAGLFKGEIEGLEGRRTGLQRHQLKAAERARERGRSAAVERQFQGS